MSDSFPVFKFTDPKTVEKFEIHILDGRKNMAKAQTIFSQYGIDISHSGLSNLYDAQWPDSALTDVEGF